MQGGINLLEAFEASRADIAAQVNHAAETVCLEGGEGLSLATCVRVRDNGSVSLCQLGQVVTLTRSQAVELMERIKAEVLAS